MKEKRFLASIVAFGMVLNPCLAGAQRTEARPPTEETADASASAAVLRDLLPGPRSVTLKLDKVVGYRTDVIASPPAVVVTLENTNPSATAKKRTVVTDFVTGTSVAVLPEAGVPTTRVVIMLTAPREHSLTWSGTDVTVELAEPASGAKAPTAAAEAAPTAPEVAPTDTAGKPVPGAGYSALVQSLSTQPVDFNFRDSDLLGILRGFAIKFNKNIVVAPDVGGRVNMQLRNVPFDEAFNTLLAQMDLVAVQKSANVIEVIKAVEMPVLVQMFSLKYRFAPELLHTIGNALSPKEKERTVLAVDLTSNALIVTSTTDMLQKVKRVLDQLDIESPQIAIKARLIEVTDSSGLTWNAAFAAQSRSDRGGTVETSRAILEMGNFTADTPSGRLNTTQAVTKFPFGGTFDVAAVLDRKTYYGLINMIKTDSRNKTISEPMILTGNNKSSKIHIGQNLPVRTTTVSQTSTVQTIQYIPEGIDLDVTPIVSPGSNVISFKIKVSVSELLGFQNDAPITTERSATTEVSVESGKTVVIGGLLRDKDTNIDSGIPFLKDIPILGYLFKGKRKSRDKTELLIFITPELLDKNAPLRTEPL